MTPTAIHAVKENPEGGKPAVSYNDVATALRQASANLATLADQLQAAACSKLPQARDALVPLKHFLADGVIVPCAGGDVATVEITKVFVTWCRFRDVPVPPLNEVRRALGPLLRKHFGVAQSHSVPRDGSQVRGFRGISFRPAEP
jgi:hypothetical protein